MTDVIVLLAVGILLGAVIGFIYKEKKRGVKCIGCPYANSCSSKSCSGHSEHNP